ncbi:oxygen-dependent protoporphyrinogen oxidase [Cohnella sp. OV330]|uniref:protoporphyrinogen oxidase n=1 Tax=Cohnella sp. OV330 TaxID=1855288 RepID=UPI0008E67E58|nr:protoporphyrinogen oxidase [Cohnella sp. OV330]SFB33633.1 oxygen-dependent protoporphyrinogen oxidase [Cohnella sp. OV330]
MSGERSLRIAIIGGGLTGLSAAFYACRLADEAGVRASVAIFDPSDRLGGKVNTLRRDGFVIERGPDSFLGRKLPMLHLAKDLGLLDELVGTNPAAVKTYLAHGGKLLPMPKGLNLGIPNDLGAFAQNSLISPHGKLRALDELRLPPKLSEEDESVGDFLERRLGIEMVEAIAEPLLAGIHAGDLYKLGLLATFPQFAEMERKYGSVIRGMIDAKRKAPAAGAKAAAARSEAVGGYPIPPTAFLTFRDGLSALIEALQARLQAYRCAIRLGIGVRSLERASKDISPNESLNSGAYNLHLDDGSSYEADRVLLALPAFAASELLSPHIDVSALERVNYVSVANVVLGFDAKRFGHKLNGSGFLVPHSEGRTITASTWTSAKWRHTAPEGKRLIRCYVGRAGDESGVEIPDDRLAEAVRHDLKELMGLTAVPEFVEITRLRRSMPQYPVGHTDAIAALRARLASSLPGVYATGAPFDAVGLPDCVEMGRTAATQMLSL